MPTITINGKKCEFVAGQMILQVANANAVAIPQYCYHDGLSIVASCRICLGEVWAVNPKSGKLEPFMGGKLQPTCQTAAADGMVVYTDSPKAVQNQKSVMEYLLINHPLDCPVCDQAGECLLQDFSYQYGRGVSRFEEQKVKQPKKDLGPRVLLYSDRCIMCSRCVRFTREVTGTAELLVQGRGNKTEIDVFPGRPLDNELSANVIDLCPVGALLDKDFLFAQRVWFLKSAPSIDGITASGDNIWIEHNEGKVYRIKPRVNMAVNRWWITDEVRYGWKFVHSELRLKSPVRRQYGVPVETDFARAYQDVVEGIRKAGGTPAPQGRGKTALVVSPMLPCEEAFALAVAARAIDPNVVLVVGPVPRRGEDKVFPPNAPEEKQFRVYAEKAPNVRGVRRVLTALANGGKVTEWQEFSSELSGVAALIVTGNYPDDWADDALLEAVDRARSQRPFTVVIDTLASRLTEAADVVLPGATWAEKAGTFENSRGMVQAFEAAIPVQELAKPEGQIAMDLLEVAQGGAPSAKPFPRTVATPEIGMDIPETVTVAPPIGGLFNPAEARRVMAALKGLEDFAKVQQPAPGQAVEAGMQMIEL
jgi:NADH-quinone oxidoreductase subunit G